MLELFKALSLASLRRHRRSAMAVGALALVAAAAAPARAAVSLTLTDSDGTPTSVTVARGSSFSVTLNIVSTAEKMTGVDYFLQVSSGAAGKFRITDRNTTGSSFGDLFKQNNGDNAAAPGVLDASFSLLNPANGLDLGASIANVSNALGAGTYALATYTLSVAADATPGTYTLSSTSPAGTGYAGAAPTFADNTFNQQASFTVTVVPAAGTGVPEPTGLGLLATLGVAGLSRRRRRC